MIPLGKQQNGPILLLYKYFLLVRLGPSRTAAGRSEAEAGALKRRRRFFQNKVLAFSLSNEKHDLSRAQALIASKPKVRFSLKQE